MEVRHQRNGIKPVFETLRVHTQKRSGLTIHCPVISHRPQPSQVQCMSDSYQFLLFGLHSWSLLKYIFRVLSLRKLRGMSRAISECKTA